MGEADILKAQRLPNGSLASMVSNDLLERIKRGELTPGMRLPSERELMSRYGVSRTVVREAISSLRSTGRVATQQGRGAFVLAKAAPAARPFPLQAAQPASRATQLALLEVRIGLESEAAALAARRRTDEELLAIDQAWQSLSIALDGGSNVRRKDRDFHMSIARATHNPFFIDIYASLQALPPDRPPRQYPSARARQQHLAQLRSEHEQIVQAIAHADADSARAAMHLHLANSYHRTVARHAQDASPTTPSAEKME